MGLGFAVGPPSKKWAKYANQFMAGLVGTSGTWGDLIRPDLDGPARSYSIRAAWRYSISSPIKAIYSFILSRPLPPTFNVALSSSGSLLENRGCSYIR